jgi:queuine tRNA-ribosyltransferase
VERTIRWARRCKVEYEKQLRKRKISNEDRPLLFGVIQGGKYPDLRKYCAEELIKIEFDGYGFGARHIDAEGNFMEDVVRETAELIPEDSLRFALGVGTPEDIFRFVNLGWDMFDCVIPTREGRHGRLFLWKRNPKSEILNPKQIQNSKFKIQNSFYETININNEKFKDDFLPVDANCDCELCQNHTRAYLKHLFVSKDPLAMRLASIHNLRFYMQLMEKLRNK